MNKPHDNWPATRRIVHIMGGLRAINDHSPDVDIYPQTINARTVQLTLPTYGVLFRAIESLGLYVVGVDFYTHVLEVEGAIPPDWRTYAGSSGEAHLSFNTAQMWSQIAHGAFKKKEGRTWDLSRRITHQLRACEWRLRETSMAYADQLNARIENRDFKPRTQFRDGFTDLIYLALHSFLVDACVLRDYLAEFAANSVIGPRYGVDSEGITRMAVLQKKVLKKLSDPDPLTKDLKTATESGGWIEVLGAYRNLIVHAAPLATAQEPMWATCETRLIAGIGDLPIIQCPIPENPSDIEKLRSNGSLFNDFSKLLDAFSKSTHGQTPGKDGLEYIHGVWLHLVQLASQLAGASPIRPEPIIINRLNIKGDVKTFNVGDPPRDSTVS